LRKTTQQEKSYLKGDPLTENLQLYFVQSFTAPYLHPEYTTANQPHTLAAKITEVSIRVFSSVNIITQKFRHKYSSGALNSFQATVKFKTLKKRLLWETNTRMNAIFSKAQKLQEFTQY
jgi:hypothetical protein